MYRAIMDNHGECIVVLSGDGNQRNCTSVSIMDAILAAMKHSIRVVVWCWKKCGSENYARLQQQYPQCFSLNFLDDCCRRPSPPTAALPAPPMMPNGQSPLPKPKASASKPAVAGGGCGGGQPMASAAQAPRLCLMPPPSPSQESDSAAAAPRPVVPKVSITITLQSCGDIIEACSAEEVKDCIRRELKGAKVARDGLLWTGKSFGQSKKDFIFINFASVRSAEAALQHYRDAPLLTLQGKQYPVTAAWDARCKALIDKAAAVADAADAKDAAEAKAAAESKAAAKAKAAAKTKAAAEAKAAADAKAAAAAKAAAEAVNAMLGLHECSKDSGTTSDADSEWDALFDFDARSETSQVTEASLLDLLWLASPLDSGSGDAAAASLSSQPASSESGSPIQDDGIMQLLDRAAGASAHVEDSDSSSGDAAAPNVQTLPGYGQTFGGAEEQTFGGAEEQTFGGADGNRPQVTAASLLELLWATPLPDAADGDDAAAALLPAQPDRVESGSPIQDDGSMQLLDRTDGASAAVPAEAACAAATHVEETGSSCGVAKTCDGAANAFLQAEPEHGALLPLTAA